jgi:hypothetical protein
MLDNHPSKRSVSNKGPANRCGVNHKLFAALRKPKFSSSKRTIRDFLDAAKPEMQRMVYDKPVNHGHSFGQEE